jgi:threonine dehydratase
VVPTFDDVRAAAGRLDGVAHRTPVVRSRLIDEAVGVEVVFKCENLQRAGVFKFSGAYNAVASLPADQRSRGVVTYSSGNHAQAIALASQLLDVPATIVMPHDAPEVKVAATAGYGATIVRYDRYTEDYEAIARDLATADDATIVPPCDHPMVIAGQGTAAMELLDDVGALDALFVPVGGGGLFSGSVIATQALSPGCRLVGVEPAAGDDGCRSIAAGHIVTIDTPQTIADGAQTRFLDPLPFEILLAARPTMLTATDDQLVDAMRLLAAYTKLVVEPTGCLGLAALRHHVDEFRGGRVGVIISGGNVDLARYAALLAHDAPANQEDT